MNEKGVARFRLSGEIYSHTPNTACLGECSDISALMRMNSFERGSYHNEYGRHMFIEYVLKLMEQDNPFDSPLYFPGVGRRSDQNDA